MQERSSLQLGAAVVPESSEPDEEEPEVSAPVEVTEDPVVVLDADPGLLSPIVPPDVPETDAEELLGVVGDTSPVPVVDESSTPPIRFGF